MAGAESMATAHTTARNLCVAVTYTDARREGERNTGCATTEQALRRQTRADQVVGVSRRGAAAAAFVARVWPGCFNLCVCVLFFCFCECRFLLKTSGA